MAVSLNRATPASVQGHYVEESYHWFSMQNITTIGIPHFKIHQQRTWLARRDNFVCIIALITVHSHFSVVPRTVLDDTFFSGCAI